MIYIDWIICYWLGGQNILFSILVVIIAGLIDLFVVIVRLLIHNNDGFVRWCISRRIIRKTILAPSTASTVCI